MGGQMGRLALERFPWVEGRLHARRPHGIRAFGRGEFRRRVGAHRGGTQHAGRDRANRENGRLHLHRSGGDRVVVTPETIVSYVRDAERRAVKTRTDARDVTKNRIVVRAYGVEKGEDGGIRNCAYDTLGRPLARKTARQGGTREDTFPHNGRSELTAAINSGAMSTCAPTITWADAQQRR